MSEAKKDPSVEATMSEPLLEASVTSLQSSLYTLRAKLDQSDPAGMYGYVHGTRLLVQRGLRLIEEQPENAEDIKQALIPVTYNLAADTWTGWPEDDVDPAYRRFGYEAAALNLKLRREKQQTGQKLAMGLWIVGVHQLAAKEYKAAEATFDEYQSLAEESGEQTHHLLMGRGWQLVTRKLAGLASTEEHKEFDALRDALNKEKDGEFYVRQMDTVIDRFLE